jgi:hypothetical protein
MDVSFDSRGMRTFRDLAILFERCDFLANYFFGDPLRENSHMTPSGAAITVTKDTKELL